MGLTYKIPRVKIVKAYVNDDNAEAQVNEALSEIEQSGGHVLGVSLGTADDGELGIWTIFFEVLVDAATKDAFKVLQS
jgi:hypothetical protein